MSVTIKLDSRFKNRVQGMFGKYEFQVGVLKDGPHRRPKIGQRGLQGKDILGQYAGGPVRKTSNKPSGKTISEVSALNRQRLGFNYLTEPFQDESSDIMKFAEEFLKIIFGKTSLRRAENLLQAIVRNPILRGEYGPNSPFTKKVKGFDRAMIDTGQLFRSIKAVCKIKGSR